MAIGRVVRPGPTRNRLISRFPKDATKPNIAPATTPGRMPGRVIRRNVVQRSAPRFCAASSRVRSKPAKLASTSRTTQGITTSTWPDSSPSVEPRIWNLPSVAISASTWNT